MCGYACKVVSFPQASPVCTSPLSHTCYMQYSDPNGTPTSDLECTDFSCLYTHSCRKFPLPESRASNVLYARIRPAVVHISSSTWSKTEGRWFLHVNRDVHCPVTAVPKVEAVRVRARNVSIKFHLTFSKALWRKSNVEYSFITMWIRVMTFHFFVLLGYCLIIENIHLLCDVQNLSLKT
jgi:hypothetical protein